MQTIWQYSPVTELQRVVFTASSIAKGIYPTVDFYILPYLPQRFKRKTVVFPDWEYSKIPGFWEEVKKHDYKIKLKPPRNTNHYLLPKIKNNLIEKTKVNKLQQEYNKIKDRNFAKLEQFFDFNKINLDKIIIRPTQYGTTGSYSLSKKSTFYLTHRIDQPAEQIFKPLILNLVHVLYYPNKNDEKEMIEKQQWHKKQTIADFLVKKTNLSELIKSNRPHTKSSSSKLALQTKKYLQKLGFPQKKALALNNGDIYYQNTKLNLPRQQDKLLKLLIKKRPQICSFSEIGNIIWQNNEADFSLYAITKNVQRLRENLKKYNIHKNIIQTKRGQGYCLIE
jgi:hypothetical protein